MAAKRPHEGLVPNSTTGMMSTLRRDSLQVGCETDGEGVLSVSPAGKLLKQAESALKGDAKRMAGSCGPFRGVDGAVASVDGAVVPVTGADAPVAGAAVSVPGEACRVVLLLPAGADGCFGAATEAVLPDTPSLYRFLIRSKRCRCAAVILPDASCSCDLRRLSSPRSSVTCLSGTASPLSIRARRETHRPQMSS